MKTLLHGSLVCLFLLHPVQAQVTNATINKFLEQPQVDAEWELICSIEQPDIVSVGMSAQRQFIATGAKDGTCQVWNIATGKKLGEFKNAGRPDCVAVSPDGKFAAVAGGFRSLRVWDVATGKLAHANDRVQGRMHRIMFSRDGEWIYLSGSASGLGRVPKLGGSGRIVGFGGRGPVPAWHVLDRDTKIVVSTGTSMIMVTLPEDEQPKVLPLSNEVPKAEAAAAGNRLIASAHVDKRVYLFNVDEDFSKPTTITAYEHNLSRVSAMGVDPKDSSVLLVREDGAVELKAVASRAIWRVRLPIDFSAQQIVVGDDGLTTCAVESTGVRIWKPTVHPLERAVERDRLVAELMGAKDYKSTSRLLNGLVERKQNSVDEVAGVLAPKFGEGKKFDDWAARLEDWCDKDRTATLPRLALSSGYISRGGRERGTGYAASVSREQSQRFRKFMDKGKARLEECQLTPEFAELILTSRATLAVAQEAPRKEAESLYKLIIKHVPQSAMAHAALVQFYQQRWHGKAGECEQYAAKVADAVSGPDGETMYARIAASLRPFYEEEDFFTRTQFDAERIIKAADGEIARAKTDRDKHFWLLQKLTWVRRTGDRLRTRGVVSAVASTKAYQSVASDEALTLEYHRVATWAASSGPGFSRPKSPSQDKD